MNTLALVVHLGIVEVNLALGKGVDAIVVDSRALQGRDEQLPAGKALGSADRADGAIEHVALPSAGAGDRGRDHHQRDVLDVVFQVELASLADGRAQQLDRLRQAADRVGRAGAVAGSLQADDKAQALQRVFFLAFDVADVFQRNRASAVRSAKNAHANANDARRNPEIKFIDRIVASPRLLVSQGSGTFFGVNVECGFRPAVAEK